MIQCTNGFVKCRTAVNSLILHLTGYERGHVWGQIWHCHAKTRLHSIITQPSCKINFSHEIVLNNSNEDASIKQYVKG